MRARYLASDLHPLTLESIEMQRTRVEYPPMCGCALSGPNWWLCEYHDGFQTGIDALLAEDGRKVFRGEPL